MRMQGGMPFWLPGRAGLGDSLIRASFIFIELHDPGSFGLLARQFN
jgi:hypothetical protein